MDESPRAWSPVAPSGDKHAIIDAMLEEGVADSQRSKIRRRLSKFPEKILTLLRMGGMTVRERPLNFLIPRDAGSFHADRGEIRIQRGGLVDFFIHHRSLSSALQGYRSVGVCTALLAIGLLCGAVDGTVALAGFVGGAFSLLFLGKLRNASASDPLEHEAAHALDFIVGRTGQFKEMPVDKRVAGAHAWASLPFSLKSRELLDCYQDCLEKREGSRFITKYARGTPMEYFAESVKAYLNSEEGGSDVNRRGLVRSDRHMHRLIERLFQDICSDRHTLES